MQNKIKYGIIAAIIIAIGAVWFVKNQDKTTVESKPETKVTDTAEKEVPKTEETEVKEEEKKTEAPETTEETDKKSEAEEKAETAEETPQVTAPPATGEEGFKALNEKEAAEELVAGDFALYDGDNIDVERYKEYKMPILITFGNEGCIYCKQMQPDLVQLNEELNGKAIVKYIDMDKYPEFPMQWPIQATPAIILVDSDGQPYDPSEKYINHIYKFTPRGSDEIALSMAYGKLDKEILEDMLGEMNHAR